MTELKSAIWTDCGATCLKCNEGLVSPDWSEFVSERLVLNLWSCTECGNRFETKAVMPADAAPKMSENDWELMFSPLFEIALQA